jgi:hypothetical protein
MSHTPFGPSFHAASPEAPPAPPATAASWRDRERLERRPWADQYSAGARLAQALLFGVVFGFLLQKGGVAKFDILVGALLLEKFIVVKVMLSAIVAGMVGVYALERLGVLELQIKETAYGANILGGLIFGVGFGLLAYCPGTDAAAVGQGNFDALVGIAGMALGSYLFALSSRFTDGRISAWGKRGKLTLPQLTHLSPGVFIAVAVPLLCVILALLERFAPG